MKTLIYMKNDCVNVIWIKCILWSYNIKLYSVLKNILIITLKYILTWKSNIILCPNVSKLYTSSMPPFFFTCIKNDIPNIAKINITKNNNKQILNKAGNDMANAKSNVLIPFAPLTKRSTRPTLATRTTRSNVGDTKYFSIRSLSTRPVLI